LPRRKKAGIILAKEEKSSKKRIYPMSNDTVFSPPKASGGVHEQIESFLETVLRGLMRPHDRDAVAEQTGKPGRPVILPSMTLWMAVLVAVLRGVWITNIVTRSRAEHRSPGRGKEKAVHFSVEMKDSLAEKRSVRHAYIILRSTCQFVLVSGRNIRSGSMASLPQLWVTPKSG